MKRSKGQGSGASKRPAVSRVQPTAARAEAEQRAAAIAAINAAAAAEAARNSQKKLVVFTCTPGHVQAWAVAHGYVLFQSSTMPGATVGVPPDALALSDPGFLTLFTRVHIDAPAPSPAATQPSCLQQAASVQQQVPTRQQQAQPQAMEQMHTASGQVSLG